MYGKLGLLAGLAVLSCAGRADAQRPPMALISIKSGYSAGPPVSAQPSGSFTVNPATKAGEEYQVVVEYGTLVNGSFKAWPGGPNAVTVGVNAQVGASNYTWGPTAVTNLVNPPADLQVRAQLQWRAAANLVWRAIEESVTPCP